MRIALVLCALVGAIGLLAALGTVAEAKGPPTRVRITGPDLPNGIEIRAARVVESLAPRSLEGGTPLPPAKGPGDSVPSYVITRYYGTQAFDQVRYVPDPEGPGRLFTDDIIYQPFLVHGVEWQPRAPGVVGRWWIPSPETERVLKTLLSMPEEAAAPGPLRPAFADALDWLLIVTLLLGAITITRRQHYAVATLEP